MNTQTETINNKTAEDAHFVAERLLKDTYGVNSPSAILLLERIVTEYINNDLSFNMKGSIKSLVLAVSKKNEVDLDELYHLFNLNLKSTSAIHDLEKNIMRVLKSLGYQITEADIYDDSRHS